MDGGGRGVDVVVFLVFELMHAGDVGGVLAVALQLIFGVVSCVAGATGEERAKDL